jgi:hypothetical protein
MKTPILAILGLSLLVSTAHASLIIPSDGSDGAFAPIANVQVDLSQAVTGAWDTNNSANAGFGIYDPSRWAVVFKFASVSIPAGVTVTFKNHPTHAPVVWLVSGNVTIDGVLKLDGANGLIGIDGIVNPEPGPGGFRGGAAGPDGCGAGLGPGGGSSSQSASYRTVYGNPQLLPLIGGSGAGGQSNQTSGSGGGGAILIAAADTIAVAGTISAKNGNAAGEYGADRGSGGAIKLIAEQVLGAGTLDALTEGRVRIETPLLATTLITYPETVAVPPSAPPVIWPPANAPTVRIVSIDGIAAPADPMAPMQASADVVIQNNSPVAIVIATTNFPIEGVVQLRIARKFSVSQLLTAAYVSGDLNAATWSVSTTLTDGFSGMQARATSP